MSNREKLNKIKEIIRQLVVKELDEVSTTGTAGTYPGGPGHYFTPYAFSGGRKKDKKKKKKITHAGGYKPVNEKMRPAVKKLLKQKGYGPIFQAIDNSKRQFKQMKYSRGEIQDTLIDMFGKEDPKILQKIKESVNEAVDKKQGAEILNQLGGNRFIMMTGAKHFGVGKEGLSFKIGRNSKQVNHIKIDYDRGRDLYNIKFDWVTKRGIKNKKTLKGVYADQLQKVFTMHTGMYTSL